MITLEEVRKWAASNNKYAMLATEAGFEVEIRSERLTTGFVVIKKPDNLTQEQADDLLEELRLKL